jgi:hypothetical protein
MRLSTEVNPIAKALIAAGMFALLAVGFIIWMNSR